MPGTSARSPGAAPKSMDDQSRVEDPPWRNRKGAPRDAKPVQIVQRLANRSRSCIAAVVALSALAGCMEFVHFGQISDREAAWSVGDVKIEQQLGDGSWKQLGRSDGRGRFSVLKNEIKGGGRVRLSKPGYHTITMSEGEFLMQNNLLMNPSEDPGGKDFGNL